MTTWDWNAAWRTPERPSPMGEPAPLREVGGTGYGRAALTAEVQTVAEAAEGVRNDTLNRAGYNLAQLVAAGHLEHDTVQQALTAAARAAGLDDKEIGATLRSSLTAGVQQPRDVPDRPALPPIPQPAIFAPPATGDVGEDDSERTSWWPQPITEASHQAEEQPEPTHLARTDGHRLLYSGKVNGLIGESESGKSWVALLAVTQAIKVAEPVLFLDFEDSADGIENRLRDMGCSDTHLGHLHYANPDEALGIAQTGDLREALALHGYTLIVVDGVNAAMTLLGYDIDASNKDATLFGQRILRPLALTGATVVTVDHVPKNKETRGKGGIGAQAKRATVTGAAIAVEVVRPFGRGIAGELRLTVDKDRPGRVRGISADGSKAGIATLTSSPEGAVTIQIEAPIVAPTFRPTGVMEKVSRLLEEVGTELGANAIMREIPGRADTLRAALDALATEGCVHRTPGPGKSVLHRSVLPFRELRTINDDPS